MVAAVRCLAAKGLSMNITKTAILAAALLMTIPESPAIPNQASLGNVAYSGSACPGGSVNVALNASKTQLRINFKQYIVEARGRNKANQRKTCSLAIPIKVPKGFSVSLVSANHNGKLSLSSGSQVRIMNAFSFQGRNGGRFKTDFKGPNSNGYSLQDPLSKLASVWSGCGQVSVLRITTSTRVKSDGGNGHSFADSGQGFVTNLRYRSCQ